MFFILSKTVTFLLLPSNLLIMLALAGVVLMLTRWRRAGTTLAVGALLVLVFAGFFPIAAPFNRLLEERFSPWDAARGAPDGIIVLGGAIDPGMSRARGEVSLNGSAERVFAIAKLARAYPDARIVYTSGDGSLLANKGAEAGFLYPVLDDFGVPRARVMLENRSRNTAENAAFTKELVRPKAGERWLLVTSAQHMPRAIGCFRRVGFNVEAYPVDWRTDPHMRLAPNTSFAGGLGALDNAAHEWIGLLAYWLTGRTSEFFPKP